MDAGLFRCARKQCKTCGVCVKSTQAFCSRRCFYEHRRAAKDGAFARKFPEELIRQRCEAIQQQWSDDLREDRNLCACRDWSPPECQAYEPEPDEPSRYDELADLGEALRWAAKHRRQRRKLRPLWVMSER